MAKRFTDTEKWKKQFVKSLDPVYKLFWFYILDECDHAGIWHVEIEIAEIRIGAKIDVKTAKEKFDNHIIEFDKGEKWFIPDFITFQYSILNANVKAHKSVIDKLKKYNLYQLKVITNSLQTVKDKDKEKDMDMDMDKVKNKDIFENFRVSYPGTKRGCDIEFVNLQKKHQNWREINQTLSAQLERQKEERKLLGLAGGFVPQWKNLRTYINQSSWEEIYFSDEIQNGLTKDEKLTKSEQRSRKLANL